jgi:hypothetical protein
MLWILNSRTVVNLPVFCIWLWRRTVEECTHQCSWCGWMITNYKFEFILILVFVSTTHSNFTLFLSLLPLAFTIDLGTVLQWNKCSPVVHEVKYNNVILTQSQTTWVLLWS